MAALLLAAGAGVALARLLNQPIRTVTVSGTLVHVTRGQIERIVRERLTGAGLATVDMAAIDHALGALPWVDQVSVQRRWPHGLAIHIVEQTAVASWNDAGLLNARGELFLRTPAAATPAADGGLPALAGPEGSEQQVTQQYLAMQARLAQLRLQLTRLTLDARGAWRFALSDGVIVRLGSSQVGARFGRFVAAAAPLVQRRAADISYVDMRYGNGFAVGWKSGAAAAPPHGSINTGDDSHFDG